MAGLPTVLINITSRTMRDYGDEGICDSAVFRSIQKPCRSHASNRTVRRQKAGRATCGEVSASWSACRYCEGSRIKYRSDLRKYQTHKKLFYLRTSISLYYSERKVQQYLGKMTKLFKLNNSTSSSISFPNLSYTGKMEIVWLRHETYIIFLGTW